ncbi:sulfotransferase [Lysobacter sp. KIS68-7]|uniref:sulfotransferase family protein n=1 Tax=Lysobacter sp. KIS68-7 TaxID=2904252 RepID=UPI001E364DAD|nr:sulfotransferase [Lysobacter sp. KIS68-7]UHQ20014.1 sulfotransferase [Lysobacter sp. KIS68-7]
MVRDAMEQARPIFIIGAPRSGTSITTWVLGQHPNIQPMPETAWIASMGVGAFLSHRKGSERGRFSHLSNIDYPVDRFMQRVGETVEAVVQDAFARRVDRLYGAAAQDPAWRVPQNLSANPMQLKRTGVDPKRRWVDGTPLNSHYVWALSEMFPDARFIHNLRRPDDVATSLEGFDKVGAEPQALEQGLDTWIQHTENAWYAERGLGGDRVFRLPFERIAGDPEALFRQVCEFLGEAWSPDCLLPLGEKLNSSEVDDKRARNRELLKDNAQFQRAQSVYELVAAQPGGAHADAEAWDIVKQRFLDYCADRSVV